jgi:hypothetical protein
VGRGGINAVAGGVGIHGLKIQVEPVRKVRDKMKGEALGSNVLSDIQQCRGGEKHTVSIWNSCIGESSLGFCGVSSSDGATEADCGVAGGFH